MELENGLEVVMRIPLVLICLGYYHKTASAWVAYYKIYFSQF